jgi:hypothetical protein
VQPDIKTAAARMDKSSFILFVAEQYIRPNDVWPGWGWFGLAPLITCEFKARFSGLARCLFGLSHERVRLSAEVISFPGYRATAERFLFKPRIPPRRDECTRIRRETRITANCRELKNAAFIRANYRKSRKSLFFNSRPFVSIRGCRFYGQSVAATAPMPVGAIELFWTLILSNRAPSSRYAMVTECEPKRGRG